MFSKVLATLLKERNISQSELATALGTHRQNVYQWVAGKTTPRPNLLNKIAVYFNVSVGYLLDEESSKTEYQPNILDITKNRIAQKVKSETDKVKQPVEERQEHLSLKEIFAENVKYYRKQAEMTQDEFAKAVGTDPVYISYIENAKRFPSIEYVEKMAEVLKVENYKFFVPRDYSFCRKSPKKLYADLMGKLQQGLDECLNEYFYEV